MIIRKFYEFADLGGGGGHTEEEEDHSPDPAETLMGKVISAKYGDERQDRVRVIRNTIDSFYLTAIALENFNILKSAELTLAKRDFQRGRQWCGKLLGELGASYPYPNKDGAAVRPDQGIALDLYSLAGLTSEEFDKEVAIKLLAAFRDKVEDQITDLTVYVQNVTVATVLEEVCNMNIISGVIGGKMWLGEIQAILAEQ